MDKLKLAALGERLKTGGERLKTGGAEMGRRVSGKMKEILQVQSQEAKMVEEATSDRLEEPNWGLNLRICGLLSSEEFNGSEVVRTIKKKISSKSTVSQRLSLDLLETCAMNCDKVFSEVASEKVLDEMVKMIDNPETHHSNKQKALQLIEAWGKSEDIGYLPIFKETYNKLKAKKTLGSLQEENSESDINKYNQAVDLPHFLRMDVGVGLSVEEKREILVITRNSIEILSSILNSDTQQKPVKDDLMLSLLEKCKESQPMIQRIIESVGEDEALMFEALSLHDELQQVLSKCEEIEFTDLPSDGHVLDDDSSSPGGMEGPSSLEKEAKDESNPSREDTKVIGKTRAMEEENK